MKWLEPQPDAVEINSRMDLSSQSFSPQISKQLYPLSSSVAKCSTEKCRMH